MKSKCCAFELIEVRTDTYPYHNPVFGTKYDTWIDYYYCPRCGLMYKPLMYKSIKELKE